MWPRYFLGRMYLPTPYQVFAPIPAPDSVWQTPDTDSQTVTLDQLVSAVLRRMGDAAASIWSRAEIQSYLEKGYRELAASRVFWDQAYLENLAPGFSCTSPWEAAYEVFSYGVANYTLAAERRLEDEQRRLGPGNHTCPDEALLGYIGDCLADASIPAVSQVPERVLEIDRAVWDRSTITALTPASLAKLDTRFQTTEGEVFGFTWRQDGVRSFRKLRVPAEAAECHAIEGSWGGMREPADISGDTVTGTWGVPRRLPTMHPIGGGVWGLPRRPYNDHLNVRVDHWRTGRALELHEETELPYHYMRYLRDYAQAMAHGRSGPGQDNKLSALYWEKWKRGLARIQHRRTALQRPRTGGFQTPPAVLGGKRPPRPKLPWQYGKELR